MPIVKATIEGREYSFAPLLIKEMRQLQRTKEAVSTNVFESIDLWKPYILSSMLRAPQIDGTVMPDVEEMDVENGSRVFSELIKAAMKASGVELAVQGEALPVSTPNGTTSSVSS